MPDTLEVYNGIRVEVDHIRPLANGDARFDITADDGRKWRIDVTRDGDIELVTSWQDDMLADLGVPEWMGDVTVRLASA